MRHSLGRTGGFSLIELMIAITLGLVLVLGTASFYSTLKGTILSTQQLEMAQESLRTTAMLMGRSLRQASSATLDAGGKGITVTYDDIQTGDTVLSCLGRTRSNGDQDHFYLDNQQLLCNDGAGAQIMAPNIVDLTISTFGSFGVQVTLKPEGLPSSLGSGIPMRFALRQKYIKSQSTP